MIKEASSRTRRKGRIGQLSGSFICDLHMDQFTTFNSLRYETKKSQTSEKYLSGLTRRLTYRLMSFNLRKVSVTADGGTECVKTRKGGVLTLPKGVKKAFSM